jgi:hypothetical protein
MFFGMPDWRYESAAKYHFDMHITGKTATGAQLRACMHIFIIIYNIHTHIYIYTSIIHVYKQYAHGDLTPLCLFSPPTPIQNSCVYT